MIKKIKEEFLYNALISTAYCFFLRIILTAFQKTLTFFAIAAFLSLKIIISKHNILPGQVLKLNKPGSKNYKGE